MVRTGIEIHKTCPYKLEFTNFPRSNPGNWRGHFLKYAQISIQNLAPDTGDSLDPEPELLENLFFTYFIMARIFCYDRTHDTQKQRSCFYQRWWVLSIVQAFGNYASLWDHVLSPHGWCMSLVDGRWPWWSYYNCKAGG